MIMPQGAITYRVGPNPDTMICVDGDTQPCAWVPGNPVLAKAIVDLLNLHMSADLIRRSLVSAPSADQESGTSGKS